jgi:hypothetical protein
MIENIMALVNQSHVVANNNNYFDAKVEGTDYRAYNVAERAIRDGAEACAKHYNLTLGQVYSAMAFYYDNYEAIQKDYEEIRKDMEGLNVWKNLQIISKVLKKKFE